jgi:hypothetical protein
MSTEVDISHIREAHQARAESLEHYAKTHEFQERQDFESVESYLSPKDYGPAFYTLKRELCDGTGKWIESDDTFSKWMNSADQSVKLLWLQGIPGAGKFDIPLSTTQGFVTWRTERLTHSKGKHI